MKNKKIHLWSFIFITTILLLIGIVKNNSRSVLASEGDVWLEPTSISIGSNAEFDVKVHIDTGRKMLGAFNMYLDFDESKVMVNTAKGNVGNGLSKGDSTNNYTLMVNPNASDQGHDYRFAGMGAFSDNNAYASGPNEIIAIVHLKTTDNFNSGNTTLSLTINELSDEQGHALSNMNVSGITTLNYHNASFASNLTSETISRLKKVRNFIFKAEKRKIKLIKSKSNYIKKRKLLFKGEDINLSRGKVILYVDGKKKVTKKIDSQGKWKIKYKAKKNSNKKYTIKLYDRNGNHYASKKYKIRVDTDDPDISIPRYLSKRKGENLYWTVEDNYKLKKVYLYFNGKKYKYKVKRAKKGEVRKFDFIIPQKTSVGLHRVKIKAYDKAGNKTIKYIVVRVR